MTDTITARDVVGSPLIDSADSKVGTIGQLYVDDQTGAPEWVTVNTGFFGTSESFVPIADASYDGECLSVPFTKDKIKGAPNVSPDGDHLPEAKEGELYQYYGVTGGTAPATGPKSAGSDDAMTRSEQRLNVDKKSVKTGTARIRKWVETENVTISVPVKKEKARLVTEPITDANRGEAMSGADLGDAEHEVTLSEERPVVSKETVPVERVRLEKETETSSETVSEEIAKERIEAEGDVLNKDAKTPKSR